MDLYLNLAICHLFAAVVQYTLHRSYEHATIEAYIGGIYFMAYSTFVIH